MASLLRARHRPPLFGDRDLTIHDDVNRLSLERQNGYGWFDDAPQRSLDHYRKWSKLHPQGQLSDPPSAPQPLAPKPRA